MTLAKRFLLGAFVCVWGLCGAGGVAMSQEYFNEPSSEGVNSRAAWEQKMVRRPNYARTTPRVQRFQSDSYGQSLEQAPRSTRGSARPVAYLADGEVPSKTLAPTPDPVIAPPKQGTRVITEGELPYVPGATNGGYVEGSYVGGGYAGGGYVDGQPCAECGDGGGMGGEYFSDDGCAWGCLGGGLLRHVTLSAGAHGFKGPLDNGLNGNFGFQEGVEVAGPLGGVFGEGLKPIGYQIGLQAFQSNFHGNQTANTNNSLLFRTADRNQVFFTVGLFKRAVCSGLQWAVNFDLLHDSYEETVDLRQVRAELSMATSDIWDWGFWGAFNGGGLHGPTASVTSVNIYSLFVRKYFENGGEGRLWGGLTDQSDGLLGLELTVPIDNAWALQNEFLYMIPGNRNANITSTSQQREAWSVAVNLVWYIGGGAACRQTDPYRPLLPLPGNNSFIADRQRTN